ncbi:hypothetical protein [Microbacterium sp.]|uniref:hypothetical protein n=1 Tax=Microbacterium sp. TaxID=51671 RepID=UPI002811EA5C|nr:hypothetical protein [Microbacterium sp.]
MPAELIVAILTSGALGGIVMKLLDMARDWRAGRVHARRAEVDRAIAERDRAIAERDRARAEVDDAEAEISTLTRWVRIVEEHAHICRRIIIDRLSTDDLPPYPSRPKES